MDIINSEHFKWLPKEIEEALGLERTNQVTSDSFERCEVIYKTSEPDVYLTNNDIRGLMTAVSEGNCWWAYNIKTKQIRLITDEVLHDNPRVIKMILSEISTL